VNPAMPMAFPGMTAFDACMVAEGFGGWEIILILSFILVLYGAATWPASRKLTGKTLDDSGAVTTQTPSASDSLALWIAQGFGSGRMPFAPGTFGSLVGLLWFAILLVPGSLALFLTGTFIGLMLSVWFCGEAERILKQTDPGSVVLDEIAAIPLCFLPWLLAEYSRRHALPPVEQFFAGPGLWHTAGTFMLFRLFDVTKPWPVRQSQGLPGGWGVTLDDVLAAIYVALIVSWFLV